MASSPSLPAPRARAPLTVDVFVDVVCPWCFLGNERLNRVLDALAAETGPAVVTHHPFFLDPSAPPEGRDIPAMLQRKYGGDPRRLWARLEAEARKDGLELDLSKQRYNYPTARAHTLIRHAEAKGTQRALVRDLYRTHFQEARNIHDPAVLAEVGERHGFEGGAVRALVLDEGELAVTRARAEEAVANGITGVPFFVFDQRLAVSGAQPEEVFQAAIRKLAEADPAASAHEPAGSNAGSAGSNARSNG
jgi:predicted DsbA family dithiol-disulfide isomerase